MVALFIGGLIGGVIGGLIGAARSSSKTDELKNEMTQLEAKMLRSTPEEASGEGSATPD
jgi:gas vesicle protein